MVAVLFETSFLNRHKLRYLTDVPYLEDGEFIVRILCLAECCIFHGQSFYQRTTRPGSATNSNLFYSERATNGFILAAENLRKFQQDYYLTPDQKLFLNQPICKFSVLVVDSVTRPFSLKRLNEIRKRLLGLGFGRLELDKVNSEFTRLGRYYNISVYYLAAIRLLTRFARSLRLLFQKTFA